MKLCSSCGELQPLSEFYAQKSNKDGLYSHCKTCACKRQARLRKDPKRKQQTRENYFRKKYGISLHDYNTLLNQQDHKCAICHSPYKEDDRRFRLFVDHHHHSGEVRALLCQFCNSGLGMFQDSPGLLIKAANYLLNKGYYGETTQPI